MRGAPVSDKDLKSAIKARSTKSLGDFDDFAHGLERAKIKWTYTDDKIVYIHKNIESESSYLKYKKMKGCRCESNLNHSPFSNSCTPLAALGKSDERA